MPRKGPAPKRPVVADPVYGAPIVSQLVNKILLDGKKGLAERIVYGALEGVATKSGQDAVVTLKKALDNVRRSRSRRTAPTPSPCAGSRATPRAAARRR
jgi:small subunit ribosomal protein S7